MQSLKKSVMFVMLAIVGAALAVAPAHAQSGLTVSVPFNFVLGKTTFQSGNYRIARSGLSFLAFTSAEGASEFALLLPGADAPSHDGNPYLVFIRYGNEAFLNKVVFSTREVYEVPLSNKEKEMRARVGSGEQMAVLVQPVR